MGPPITYLTATKESERPRPLAHFQGEERVNAIVTIVAPEGVLQLRIQDREGTLPLPLFEEPPVGIQGLGPALLEDDAPAVVLVERAVELPLANEGGRNLFPGRPDLLRILRGRSGNLSEIGDQVVQRLELRAESLALRVGQALRLQLAGSSSRRLAWFWRS